MRESEGGTQGGEGIRGTGKEDYVGCLPANKGNRFNRKGGNE